MTRATCLHHQLRCHFGIRQWRLVHCGRSSASWQTCQSSCSLSAFATCHSTRRPVSGSTQTNTQNETKQREGTKLETEMTTRPTNLESSLAVELLEILDSLVEMLPERLFVAILDPRMVECLVGRYALVRIETQHPSEQIFRLVRYVIPLLLGHLLFLSFYLLL